MKKFIKNLIIFLVIILFAVTAYYLYDNLRERTRAEKLAEIIHLEDSRVLNDKLTKYLDSPDLDLRSRAVLAVGRIADRRSPSILLNLLADTAIDVAVTAAFAMGLTGDKESRYPAQLSGGEQQRVAIARALVKQPRLILADEPTGNLDSARSTEIYELLEQIARSYHTAVLVVTHDNTIAESHGRDHIHILDGRLVSEEEVPGDHEGAVEHDG